MKKLYPLSKKPLLPKKETINMLLAFSKNLAVIKNKNKTFIISKN
jgi:hypothetical protein